MLSTGNVLCRVNDIIVSVNGISTVNVTHGQAVDALKRAGNVVSLVRLAFCDTNIQYLRVSTALIQLLRQRMTRDYITSASLVAL